MCFPKHKVDNAAARTSELINADPVALGNTSRASFVHLENSCLIHPAPGLPAVYAQHKLNPLCEYKVEKVVEVMGPAQ